MKSSDSDIACHMLIFVLLYHSLFFTFDLNKLSHFEVYLHQTKLSLYQ